MLALRSPHEAYRKVDFDARVEGADPRQLLALCYEQLIEAIGSALSAHASDNNQARSQAVTRALAAVTALQLGVAGEGGVANALLQFYASIRSALLDCALHFAPGTLTDIRRDVAEVAAALTEAG